MTKVDSSYLNQMTERLLQKVYKSQLQLISKEKQEKSGNNKNSNFDHENNSLDNVSEPKVITSEAKTKVFKPLAKKDDIEDIYFDNSNENTENESKLTSKKDYDDKSLDNKEEIAGNTGSAKKIFQKKHRNRQTGRLNSPRWNFQFGNRFWLQRKPPQQKFFRYQTSPVKNIGHRGRKLSFWEAITSRK